MTILKEKKYSDKTRNAIWWGGLCCIGLNLQRLVPGVDFLLPGLLVAMQERRYADLIWAVPLLVILQEGAGTLEFGLNLLRYMTAALLFFLGRWLFDVERLLYMLLLSACLAASCFAVAFLVSP